MQAWDTLKAGLEAARAPLTDGLVQAPVETQALQKTLLDALDRPEPPPADIPLYGALLTFFGHRPTYKHPSRSVEAVALAAEVGGGAFAVDAVRASEAWGQRTAASAGIYTRELSWIEPAHPDEDHEETWLALREVLRAVPALRPSATERAHAILAEVGRGHPTHWALACALPDAALLDDDDLRRVLCDDADPGLLFDVAVLADATRVVAPAATGWGLEGLPEIDELAALGGLRALAALRRYVRGFAYDPHDGEVGAALKSLERGETLEKACAAAHVTAIGGVDALRLLAEAAHREKEVLPAFLFAAERAPDDARAALQALRSGRLPKLDRWRSTIVRRPLLDALASMLEPTEGPEATTPPELASPPWTTAKAKSTKSVAKTKTKKGSVELRVVPHEERLDWGKRDPSRLFELEVEDEAEWLARIEEDDDRTFFLFQVMHLGDDKALELLRATPATKWYGDVGDVEALLARFGLDVLDLLLPYVKRQPDRFPALKAVDSPRVAPLAAHLFATSKKVGPEAKKWLHQRPRAAAVGIVAALPDARGKDAKSLALALDELRTKHAAIVDEVVAAAGADSFVGSAITAVKAAPTKAPKLPAWVRVDRLVRPRLPDGSVLSEDATRTLVELLALSKRDDPDPALRRLADACDPVWLDRFAWSLFVLWLAEGGPPKHGFGLDAMGLFGSPATLRVLGERAREWAPGGLPSRAQATVDVLTLATGMAGLAAIHRLTQVRSRALARHAQKVLGATAKKLGLTKADLVDRLVPDLGLDADGSTTFDYGSRAFSLQIDDTLAPVIVDASGKRLADLPKPRADEEELGKETTARWRELKKEIKRVLREQAPRFEQMLSEGRRVSTEHFEASFSRHPLLQHLAHRLVWVAFEGETRVTTFAVTLDEYLDLEDRPIELTPAWQIGLLHPIDASPDELSRWGDRLSDYRIVQPFPQLARSVFRLHDDEREATALSRFAGRVVPTGKVLGLDRLGWMRDAGEQGGRVWAWRRSFGRVVATLPLDPGVYLGAPMDDPEQTLGPLGLSRGDDAVAFESLTPLQTSELLRDLEELTAH
ncbi:MAG: DUF4132 domain-containing protein [Sandaracinus sp.]|nr:DUF4132 domain-containing protein [Sandaracinus sp.]